MNDQIERIQVRSLGDDEWKTLKSIRLNQKIGEFHVWAELIYTRDVAPDYVTQYKMEKTASGYFYNTKTIFPDDDFDKMVLKAVRTKYPEAVMCNLDVRMDTDIQRLKTMYDGYLREQAIVYLTPNFDNIDIWSVPRGTSYTQFRVGLDLFAPCKAFMEYFKNEGYFDDYELANKENLEKMLDKSLPTVKHMPDLWLKEVK